VLSPPSGGGIVSLQALTSADNGGNLILTSTDDSINFNVDAPTGAIDLAVNFPDPPPAGIVSLQGLDAGDNGGVLNLASASGTVTFSTDANLGRIDLLVNFPTLSQFGTGDLVVPENGFPADATVLLPVSYADDASYAPSVILGDVADRVSWVLIDGLASDGFKIVVNSDNTTARTIKYYWTTVGTTPPP
jgi:hypothetical protein